MVLELSVLLETSIFVPAASGVGEGATGGRQMAGCCAGRPPDGGRVVTAGSSTLLGQEASTLFGRVYSVVD